MEKRREREEERGRRSEGGEREEGRGGGVEWRGGRGGERGKE